jgi:polyhydroxybutyrate depolymerase
MNQRVVAIGLSVFLAACGDSASTEPFPSSPSTSPDSGSPSGSGPGGTIPGGGTGGTGAGGSADGGDPGDAASPVVDGSQPPAAGCSGTQEWKPGDAKTVSITFGGAARSYDVHVGKKVTPGTAVPLLVNVHGLTNSPALQAQFSQMNPVADDKGFVVVYPAGLNASFNAGTCCGQSSSGGVDDVGFIRAIVAEAQTKICVDAKRVYQTGFSNGGMMSYQLACNAADLFAAVAPTEGSNMTRPPCKASRQVPLAAFEYQGDTVVSPATAQKSAQDWAKQNGCTDASPTSATVSSFTCDQWSKCGGGSSVWYCTLPGGTHYPPAGSAPVIWSFLSQYTLP